VRCRRYASCSTCSTKANSRTCYSPPGSSDKSCTRNRIHGPDYQGSASSCFDLFAFAFSVWICAVPFGAPFTGRIPDRVSVIIITDYPTPSTSPGNNSGISSISPGARPAARPAGARPDARPGNTCPPGTSHVSATDSRVRTNSIHCCSSIFIGRPICGTGLQLFRCRAWCNGGDIETDAPLRISKYNDGAGADVLRHVSTYWVGSGIRGCSKSDHQRSCFIGKTWSKNCEGKNTW